MIYYHKDPYKPYLFRVELDMIFAGGFSEVSGLSIETSVKSFREGGVNNFERKLPEYTKQTDLTLKRGLGDVDLLWKWYESVQNGKIVRKSGSIILFNDLMIPVVRWNFKEAFPIKWEGPQLNATTTNTVAFESIVLAHHGLQRA